MNPTWQQKKLREYCQAKGIFITAYSPLGAAGTPWGSNNVVDNELLKEIAEAHGKSFAQVTIFHFSFPFSTKGNKNFNPEVYLIHIWMKQMNIHVDVINFFT